MRGSEACRFLCASLFFILWASVCRRTFLVVRIQLLSSIQPDTKHAI